MSHVKLYYVNYLFLRLTKEEADQERRANKKFEVLQECVKEMKKVAYDAQKSYAEEVWTDWEMKLMKEGRLVERMSDMMVIDGCFILELLYSYYDHMKEQGRKPTNGGDIGNPKDTMSPEDNSQNRGGSPNDCVLHISGKETTKNYYHILHLLHDNYLPSNMQESGPKTKFSEFTLSAANLEYAGVKFKPLSGNNLFDVKFNEDKGLYWWCRRANFEIPTIGIHDPTEPFLRNLIAFEQCCPGVSQHFTSYAFLMGMLINSQADFQVLKDAKVIKSYLGADEDTLNLFNKLCKEVAIANFYFADPCSRAYNYSQHGWPKFMAYLKRTYFGSPWAFIGFCVAFIAFGMSVIQFGWSFLKKSG